MIDQHTRGVVIDMGMCLRVPYEVLEANEAANNIAILKVTDIQSARSENAELIDPVAIRTTGRRRRRCLFKPQGTCGKLPYMSPEIYWDKKPFDGEAVDVWTAGTILFCMVTGNRSYQRPDVSDVQFYFMTKDIQKLLHDWKVNLSYEGIHLLKNMLQINPRLRLSLQEVLNHPWFDHPDIEVHQPNENEDGAMEFALSDDEDEEDDDDFVDRYRSANNNEQPL